MLQQPHLPPLRPFGENSHFVGVGNSMNPPSPATTPPGRVTIDIDVDDGVDVRGVKKRFWVHDEEVKLVITLHNSCVFHDIHYTTYVLMLISDFIYAGQCLAKHF
jgi:hypothetical protein